jgi:hypothetical protein
MALEFNTIGIKLKYAVETTAGSRPTSGYVNIPDIKEIPEINMTPSNLDVTNLVDPYKRYIPGVKDAGNDIALTSNLTADLKTKWASCVSAAATAWNSGKATWFEIAIPNFDSFYVAGVPTEMGVSSMGVDAVVEAQLHIIPNQIGGWATASS